MHTFTRFFRDEDSVAKIAGGIFAVIAIIAAVVENAFGAFNFAAVAGDVKDISGTLVSVAMLVVTTNALKPKTEKNTGSEEVIKPEMLEEKRPLLKEVIESEIGEEFEDTFEQMMKMVMARYSSLVVYCGRESTKKWTDMMRYDIDSTLVAGTVPSKYSPFFRVKSDEIEVTFSVPPAFGARCIEVAAVVGRIILESHWELVAEVYTDAKEFDIVFYEPLTTAAHAKALVLVVDHVLRLFLEEYKKG